MIYRCTIFYSKAKKKTTFKKMYNMTENMEIIKKSNMNTNSFFIRNNLYI